MSMLSLREAAQLCGRGKSTIQAAIKAGKLSAGRNEQGGYEIDPAELHRVFEFNVSSDRTEDTEERTEDTEERTEDTKNRTAQDTQAPPFKALPVVSGSVQKKGIGTGHSLSDAETRVRHLEELLAAERAGCEALKEALQARVDDLQGTISDLRKRLDVAEEEKLRLLPPPVAPAGRVPKRQSLWARLTDW